MIRTVPIGKTPVFIKVAIQRVQCLCCKKGDEVPEEYQESCREAAEECPAEAIFIEE